MCGIPDVFYTDHGSDFTSAHLEQVGADLKMQLVFSQVGRPRGRGKIERFFQSVEQLLLEQLPGYAPKSAWPQGGGERQAEPRSWGADAWGTRAAFSDVVVGGISPPDAERVEPRATGPKGAKEAFCQGCRSHWSS